jgi:hypothetical protein
MISQMESTKKTEHSEYIKIHEFYYLFELELHNGPEGPNRPLDGSYIVVSPLLCPQVLTYKENTITIRSGKDLIFP